MSSNPVGERRHELLQELARSFIRELAICIEKLVGAAEISLRLRHRRHVQEYQRLSQVMVGAKSADGAGRGADDGSGLAVPRILSIWTRGAIERVLQHAGNRAVVFGRYEKNGIRGFDSLAKLPPLGRRIGVGVLIVERKVTDLDGGELQ